ncbi:GPI biosynthesis protein family Pig-F-domain-containing protein [Mrakia frigida]|uniref:mannose-ethanolamine phosphotransferase GPI11 n=1 Tax=Mrakia frigida TaxID=29902 RepID=UPI003FCC1996
MSVLQDWTQDLTRRITSLAQKPTFPKPKRRAAPSSSTPLPSSFSPLRAFPLGRYLSLLSVFSLLQIFILLALPQTPFPFPLSSPRTKTSLDRPEWAWVAVWTKDPLATSVWVVLGGAVVAAWWAGEMSKMWEQEEERKAGGKKDGDREGENEEERVRRKAEGNSKVVQTFKASISATLLASLLLHFFLLLLGAPLRFSLQTQAETYALSLVIAFLTVFTPVWVLGVPPIWGQDGGKDVKGRWVWTRLFIEVDLQTPLERAVVYPVLFTILGAWIGAFPIALDWDRPWQAWPLTPLTGALLGCIAGQYWSFGKTAWETIMEAGELPVAAVAGGEVPAVGGGGEKKKVGGSSGAKGRKVKRN